jgi:hypothetical protein
MPTPALLPTVAIPVQGEEGSSSDEEEAAGGAVRRVTRVLKKAPAPFNLEEFQEAIRPRTTREIALAAGISEKEAGEIEDLVSSVGPLLMKGEEPTLSAEEEDDELLRKFPATGEVSQYVRVKPMVDLNTMLTYATALGKRELEKAEARAGPRPQMKDYPGKGKWKMYELETNNWERGIIRDAFKLGEDFGVIGVNEAYQCKNCQRVYRSEKSFAQHQERENHRRGYYTVYRPPK